MSEPFYFLLACLATFRAGELIVVDDGPFHVFKRLRECSTHPLWCELLNCYYCCGVWIAGACTVLLWAMGKVSASDAWLWWLGVAGGAAVIRRVIGPRL